MNNWTNPDFDPYRDLVELKNFAQSTDTHLGNLLKNEREIVKAINQLSSQLKNIEKKIEQMEKNNETTR